MAVALLGVETAAAWTHLKALGCDFAQGYYLSKPVPAAEIEALVHASSEDGPRAAAV